MTQKLFVEKFHLWSWIDLVPSTNASRLLLEFLNHLSNVIRNKLYIFGRDFSYDHLDKFFKVSLQFFGSYEPFKPFHQKVSYSELPSVTCSRGQSQRIRWKQNRVWNNLLDPVEILKVVPNYPKIKTWIWLKYQTRLKQYSWDIVTDKNHHLC